MLRTLQASAGNTAVTALVQRFTGSCSGLPTAPVAVSPMDDPRFAVVAGKVGRAAAKQRSHPPAAAKAAEAQHAAEPPSNDRSSQAAAAQTEVMNAQQPGTFDKKAFVAAVRRAIEAKAPKNLEEADEYASSGKAGQVKDEVGGLVGQGKDTASKSIKSTTGAPPDQSRATAKPVVPMRDEKPGAAPSDPGSAGAVPQPVPPDQTDLRHGPCQVSGKLAEADVTDQQLAEANEPEFSQALDSKQQLAEHAATAPQQVRAAESATLGEARGAARADAGTGLKAMHATRTSRLGQVSTLKTGAKAKDEVRRAEVAGKIQSLYEATKTEVTSILDGLDAKVNGAFDQGEREARSGFETQVDREMRAFRDRRYSGLDGAARWAWDKLTSPPAEVNQIFDRARAAYLTRMGQVIERVADIVGTELNRTKDRINRGRNDINTYVASLPKELRGVGQEAAEQMAGQFDALEQDVSARQETLVQGLADRYVAAQNSINERVTALQEENKGLLQKAADAVDAVVDTIRKLKDMLLNVLTRAKDAVGHIIKTPIRFLGHLVSGVKAGLQQFIANIGSHLQKGLIGWLTGALGSAGITLPDRFDLRGVISLVMQLLGLTWSNLRSRLVAKLGEPLVRHAETAIDIVKVLVAEGPAGLWRWLVDKLADLKDTVLGEIKNFLITKVIMAGIQWIIGLLNPAGAFIKACKAIYDIVMFFVTRGSQIMSLVNAVIEAIGAIARGSVGGVASLIENVLAKGVPVLIGFLASLLGLGGISEKVRSILEKVQKPVNKAIDWIIDKVVAGAKRLAGRTRDRLRGGDDSPEGKQQRLKRAMAAARHAVIRFRGRPVGVVLLGQILAVIRHRYGLTALEPIQQARRWSARGVINPTVVEPLDIPVKGDLIHDIEPEFTSQFEATVAVLQQGYRVPGVTRLSRESARHNRQTVERFLLASASSSLTIAEVRRIAFRKIAAALVATDGDSIYRLLREAQAPVNALYPRPKPLQVHHQEHVKEHPATFPQTRLVRLRAKMARKIKAKSLQPGTDEARIASIAQRDRRLVEIQRWAEKQLEHELLTAPELLTEVNMWIMAKHSVMHNKRARDFYEENRRRVEEAKRIASGFGGGIP